MTGGDEVLNIHDWLGWDRCANPRCQVELHPSGYAELIRSTQTRRFCCLDHIVEGEAAWKDALDEAAKGGSLRLTLEALYGLPVRSTVTDRAHRVP